MSERFLLIHGACHGAWCWHRVIPALQALGHEAVAIDLPGRGAPAGITLADFAAAILAAIDRPSLLVGHSMAGFPITAAAETDPARIRALVYLCAFVPAPGQSIATLRRAAPDAGLTPALRVAPDRQSFTFDPARAADLFYHDCPAEDRALAAARLCAEPVAPQETALRPTARSLSLPRHYIRCTDDRAIPPRWQTEMAEGIPPARIHDLAAGHSPFFAAPQALAARLSAIANSL